MYWLIHYILNCFYCKFYIVISHVLNDWILKLLNEWMNEWMNMHMLSFRRIKMYIKSDNVAGKSVLYSGGCPWDMWSYSQCLVFFDVSRHHHAGDVWGRWAPGGIRQMSQHLARLPSPGQQPLACSARATDCRRTYIRLRPAFRGTFLGWFSSECMVKMKTVQQCDSMQDNVGGMSSAQLRKVSPAIVWNRLKTAI